MPSSKAKRDQALRNILAARRRQILSQRSHEPSRIFLSRTPRPADTTLKDSSDILETQETRHSVYVTSAGTEASVEEETSRSLRKPIEEVAASVPVLTGSKSGLQSPNTTSETSTTSTTTAETITTTITTTIAENYVISTPAASITSSPAASINQKTSDADARRKNTVSMPESLYNHFRPVESNIPVEDMSQFLYFGQKLQPDMQNTTNSSNNNSVETTSAVPTSRRRYSAKRFSATVVTPIEEIMNEEMNIALERRTVEKNQVSRIKNTYRSPGSGGLYYRKLRPTDVVSNVIPGNESSTVAGSDLKSEINTVDDKFRGDQSAHADTLSQRGSTVAHVYEASPTTQIPRQRHLPDNIDESSLARAEIEAKSTNDTNLSASRETLPRKPTSDFRKSVAELKVELEAAGGAETTTKSAENSERKLTGVIEAIQARARSRESNNIETSPASRDESARTTPSRTAGESSTLRIVVPDESFGRGFAIESKRTHQDTVKQPVGPVADRPVRVLASGDIAPKTTLSTESVVPVVVLESNQRQRQQQQPHQQQQHVYAYTITNVTRLLRNYTGPGLNGEEQGGAEGGGGEEGGDGSGGRRRSSGAEITSGEPSQRHQQQQQQQQSPPQSSSSLLLPRADDGGIVEPVRSPAGLSAGATVEPVAAAGASLGVVVGLVGERPRKVVPQQQQRATIQRATWSPHPGVNDSVSSPTRPVKSTEINGRGSVRWHHGKSRANDQEGANDRRFLRKSASAVLNQRSTASEEGTFLVTSKRRRLPAAFSGLSVLSGSNRRVKSHDREKNESAKSRVPVVDDRLNRTTFAARSEVSDDETTVAAPREVARASRVNEVPRDSSQQGTTGVMGNFSRDSSDETMDATDPSVFVDTTMPTEVGKPDVLAVEGAVTSSVKDEDELGGVATTSGFESDVNTTTDKIATTVTVTEQADEMVALTTTTTTIPAAPVFPVTPRILTDADKTTSTEPFTLRPTDAAKLPEADSNRPFGVAADLDPSEIQKRYRAKDATTTISTTASTMTTTTMMLTATTTTVPPTQNDTRQEENTSSILDGQRTEAMPASSTPAFKENGKRVSGERSPEVRARNLSDKSKDKDEDVLPIMHLYNTSDIFNSSGPMESFVRGAERPRIVLPVDPQPKHETTMKKPSVATTTTVGTSESSVGSSTSTTVPVPKQREPTATPPSSRKDKHHEENRDYQSSTTFSSFRGAPTIVPAANRTRYRPSYHHSILPEYNDTMYPAGLNRTFLEIGPISVSPRESMNISEVISKRHDGDAIATQETVAVVSYILATLVVFPIAVGVGLILRRLILRNRKVLEESDTSSEISCRKDVLNLESGDFKTSIEKAITKLPRIQHLCHEAEKPPPPSSQESRWEFPRDKLRLQTVLGQGNFGQVWKAEADDLTGHQGTTRLVAVKTVKEGASDREKEDLVRELEIMQQLGSHPNVVTLLGCCTEEEPHYLILEYVMYGKLLAYLRDHRTRQYFYNFSEDSAALTSRDLTVFGYCVARGMEYLASKKIIHRDLAARNVLVDHNKLCKIADFGMSRFANEDDEVIETRHGRNALPIRWMAPESLIYSLFTTKTDVWSFGILMWEIVTLGSTPYPDMTAREVMRNVHNGYRLERPSHCRSELFRVISRCWHADPDRRPEFQTLRRDLAQLLEDNMNGHYVDLESFASECTD